MVPRHEFGDGSFSPQLMMNEYISSLVMMVIITHYHPSSIWRGFEHTIGCLAEGFGVVGLVQRARRVAEAEKAKAKPAL